MPRGHACQPHVLARFFDRAIRPALQRPFIYPCSFNRVRIEPIGPGRWNVTDSQHASKSVAGFVTSTGSQPNGGGAERFEVQTAANRLTRRGVALQTNRHRVREVPGVRFVWWADTESPAADSLRPHQTGKSGDRKACNARTGTFVPPVPITPPDCQFADRNSGSKPGVHNSEQTVQNWAQKAFQTPCNLPVRPGRACYVAWVTHGNTAVSLGLTSPNCPASRRLYDWRVSLSR